MYPDPQLGALSAIAAHSYNLEIATWQKHVALPFVASIENIGTLSYLLPGSIQTVLSSHRAMTKAAFDLTGGIIIPSPGTDLFAKFVELMETRDREQKSAEDIESEKQEAIDFWSIATDDRPLAKGLQTYMGSIVNSTWTVFEVLAGDLWEAALNYHPQDLAALKGDKSRIARLSAWSEKASGSTSNQTISDKSVNLNILEKHDFNLSNSMGSILKPKQSFDSLEGIRSAFSVAFHCEYSEIDRCLAVDSLDTICAIRNLFTHKGGRIDKRFVKITSKFLHTRDEHIGSQLYLTGQQVAGLVIPVLDCGCNLIMAVDQWTEGRPTKPSTTSEGN